MQYRVTWSAALYAGVAAGILATLVQIALWSIFADVLPTILFRDARFTAAIVMGRAVLPPPATFDERIMLVATLVHFALSIIYGLSVSWVIARLRAAPSLLVGAMFGLAVYGMNMYAFTELQAMMAGQLGVPPGEYIHIADSFHIYGSYFKEFEGRFLGMLQKRSFEQRTMRYEDVREMMEEARPMILEKVKTMGKA